MLKKRLKEKQDFYTDVYNIIVLLPEEERKKKYVRRAAGFLKKEFVKEEHWRLAAVLRDIEGGLWEEKE
jgi:tRNA(Met) C34 N-acetyltransferase TmcA